MILSAVIQKSCKSTDLVALFFADLKKYTTLSKVKSAVPIGDGIEVTFIDQSSLSDFLASAPAEWSIRSELKKELLLTISPQFG